MVPGTSIDLEQILDCAIQVLDAATSNQPTHRRWGVIDFFSSYWPEEAWSFVLMKWDTDISNRPAVRAALLLALTIPRKRPSPDLQRITEQLIQKALADPNETVRTLAAILKDVPWPTNGGLTLELDPNLCPIFEQAFQELRTVSFPSTLFVPRYMAYLDPDVVNGLIPGGEARLATESKEPQLRFRPEFAIPSREERLKLYLGDPMAEDTQSPVGLSSLPAKPMARPLSGSRLPLKRPPMIPLSRPPLPRVTATPSSKTSLGINRPIPKGLQRESRIVQMSDNDSIELKKEYLNEQRKHQEGMYYCSDRATSFSASFAGLDHRYSLAEACVVHKGTSMLMMSLERAKEEKIKQRNLEAEEKQKKRLEAMNKKKELQQLKMQERQLAQQQKQLLKQKKEHSPQPASDDAHVDAEVYTNPESDANSHVAHSPSDLASPATLPPDTPEALDHESSPPPPPLPLLPPRLSSIELDPDFMSVEVSVEIPVAPESDDEYIPEVSASKRQTRSSSSRAASANAAKASKPSPSSGDATNDTDPQDSSSSASKNKSTAATAAAAATTAAASSEQPQQSQPSLKDMLDSIFQYSNMVTDDHRKIIIDFMNGRTDKSMPKQSFLLNVNTSTDHDNFEVTETLMIELDFQEGRWKKLRRTQRLPKAAAAESASAATGPK
ncbi:uncharacterized protein BJ171DRAFT_581950 [Polychytrium aggregatum]|uniref:uncharacterized protein n=1 Tax=Polychytrium aggregatum TaxID=110093 RepID=UPI0022FE19F7|nr:uncharacterized protein BJ171DRAFT_581950 [Polychytrium aggregatum]KAI9204369.1 hypothetical protein BJ171DRAFT_581950 [Polychytrium aggregatum]